MNGYVACTLKSMPIVCGLVINGQFMQFASQYVAADQSTVKIVGYLDAPPNSYTSEFRCEYSGDPIISIPAYYQVSGRTYASLTIRLSYAPDRPAAVSFIDNCATVSDCTINVELTTSTRCRLIVSVPNGATLSIEPARKLYIDGVEYNGVAHLSPGIHIVELRGVPAGNTVLVNNYTLTVGGYKFKMQVYEWGFI